MPVYKAPIREFEFVLKDYLGLEQHQDVAGFADVGDDLQAAILEEGARFCEEVLFPLNQKGDQQGLKFDNGKVTLPDGFVDAYKQYVEGVWLPSRVTQNTAGRACRNSSTCRLSR